ncbi:MAG: hypothetical protein ABIQ54_00270 [Gammaproteobacteria bacterium]
MEGRRCLWKSLDGKRWKNNSSVEEDYEGEVEMDALPCTGPGV